MEEELEALDRFLTEEQSTFHFVKVDGQFFLEAADQDDASWGSTSKKETLEKTEESLVKSYLSSNMNRPRIPLKEFIDEFERKIISHALQICMGNQRKAAHLLGVKPTTLGEKLKRMKNPPE